MKLFHCSNTAGKGQGQVQQVLQQLWESPLRVAYVSLSLYTRSKLDDSCNDKDLEALIARLDFVFVQTKAARQPVNQSHMFDAVQSGAIDLHSTRRAFRADGHSGALGSGLWASSRPDITRSACWRTAGLERSICPICANNGFCRNAAVVAGSCWSCSTARIGSSNREGSLVAPCQANQM